MLGVGRSLNSSLLHPPDWELGIFLHLFLWQQIIGSQKEVLLPLILNNPGLGHFFCIYCQNEVLLFNPWQCFLSLRSNQGNPVWGKDGKVLREDLVSDISEFSGRVWHWILLYSMTATFISSPVLSTSVILEISAFTSVPSWNLEPGGG